MSMYSWASLDIARASPRTKARHVASRDRQAGETKSLLHDTGDFFSLPEYRPRTIPGVRLPLTRPTLDSPRRPLIAGRSLFIGTGCAASPGGIAWLPPCKEVIMRHSSLCLACAATLAFAAPGAQAVTCNIVLDRNGNVIYQDTLPPVDLSERGAAARDKMRQRGEQLLISDADQCPQLVFSTVTGAASVESIVAEMRPYNAITGGMGASARTSG